MGKFSWLMLAPVYGEVPMIDACTGLWGSSYDGWLVPVYREVLVIDGLYLSIQTFSWSMAYDCCTCL